MKWFTRPSVLWSWDGLYLWEGSWKPLKHLSQCPSPIDLWVYGLPIQLESQKLPPMHAYSRWQLLQERMRYGPTVSGPLWWGMIQADERDHYLNGATAMGGAPLPDFGGHGIQVYTCRWLGFELPALINPFQNQQPCGGVILVAPTLSKETQVAFVQKNCVRLVRNLLLSNNSESALDKVIQETIHYCLNEYGMDPADLKVLNCTGVNVKGAYELGGYKPGESIENKLFKTPLSWGMSFKSIFTRGWGYGGRAFPFGLKPRRGLLAALHTLIIGGVGVVLSQALSLWMTHQSIEDLKHTEQVLTQEVEKLIPQFVQGGQDWEILEKLTSPGKPFGLWNRLGGLGGLRDYNLLIQEIFWEKTAGAKEVLKIRLNDHPSLMGDDPEEPLIYERAFEIIQGAFQGKAQVFLHNNQIEVIF